MFLVYMFYNHDYEVVVGQRDTLKEAERLAYVESTACGQPVDIFEKIDDTPIYVKSVDVQEDIDAPWISQT